MIYYLNDSKIPLHMFVCDVPVDIPVKYDEARLDTFLRQEYLDAIRGLPEGVVVEYCSVRHHLYRDARMTVGDDRKIKVYPLAFTEFWENEFQSVLVDHEGRHVLHGRKKQSYHHNLSSGLEQAVKDILFGKHMQEEQVNDFIGELSISPAEVDAYTYQISKAHKRNLSSRFVQGLTVRCMYYFILDQAVQDDDAFAAVEAYMIHRVRPYEKMQMLI